jgi:predicted lactoylglutathione lyase
MKLPPPVPELPVSDLAAATKAYASQMGFRLDWTYEDFLAGISRDAARLFLRRRTPPEDKESSGVLIWLNMTSSAEVDQLYEEWTTRGVVIVEPLCTASYNLRQFIAQDIDGNRFRVFYDLGRSGA